MQQQMDSPDPVLPSIAKSRPLFAETEKPHTPILFYRVARLAILIGLVLFWVVVIRAIF